MALESTPQASFESLKSNVVDGIKNFFPFKGSKQTLVLEDIHVDDKLSHDDIRGQALAKDNETTWGVPVKATLKLIDNASGKVVDTKKNAVLARLPKLTNRYGFIVNGNEYQVDHLFRLKAGAYARVQANGDLETEFHLLRSPLHGRGFSVQLDNKSKKFSLMFDSTHIPLYPILKATGVSDDDIENAWGKQVFEANKTVTPAQTESALKSFWKKTSEEGAKAPHTVDDMVTHVNTFFEQSHLLPDTTKITLGKPFTNVNGDALNRAAKKILGVAAGTEKPDDRDSLVFKDIVGVEDFVPERLQRNAKIIHAKVRNVLNHKSSVSEIVSPDLFNKPIMEFFTKGGSVAERSEQTNPIQMLSAHRKTTLMSKDMGGIKSDRELKNEMRAVNPSHLGFLDPMHTPESERTGITLHLGIAAKKNGKNLETPVYDISSGKLVYANAPDFHGAMAVLPDQVKWVGGKPVPLSDMVKVKLPGGDVEKRPFKEAKYVMPSAKGMFDFASNLIPFLPTVQGNRSAMADKQMEQAISLKHREAPLVQTKTDHPDPTHTFEKQVGQFVSTRSPVSGKVVEVKKDAIVLHDGKEKHEVHLYDHFPLNDPKGMMHSTPLVSVGDQVKAGQVVADSNYTKNGHLSIGTNLRIGYIPYKGYNFEDGIVISDEAARKLTSEHLHTKTLEVDRDNDVVSKDKLKAHAIVHSSDIEKEHWDALDDDGIIKPGTRVKSGQVMVAAVGKNITKAGDFLSGYGKKMFNPLRDRSLRWDEDHTGIVTRVVKAPNGKSVKVYVKTEEPAVVGDKLTGRYANKGIITKIIPKDQMPFTMNEKGEKEHLEVLLNPSGVPTRMNVGQVLETAAAKLAKKTGKPYIVNNFSGPNQDYREQVLSDLKKHGISDEELVFDPSNPTKPLGSVLVGPQYILKLKHQVEKKMSARGGGATSVEGKRLEYSPDRQPLKGSPHGGQGFSALDMYALLGHDARHNIREMATYKSDMQDQLFWSMIQQGHEPPPPKTPFAYNKFVSMLNGLGLNVTKDGTGVRLVPMTNKEVLHLADGGKNEIKDATFLRSKDLKEEHGGLFDPKTTGGKDGDKWAFIKLHEPLPNPIFVGHGNKAGPVVELLNLQVKDIDEIVTGKAHLNGLTGGKAIEEALRKIDVNKEISELRQKLPTLSGPLLDRSNKKLKYLLALKDRNLRPEEAYILHNVPVIPPKFRPPSQTPTGDVTYPPINGLYRNLFLVNRDLKEYDPRLPEDHKSHMRVQLWDAMKAIESVGKYKPVYDTDKSGNRQLRGILDVISKGAGEHGQPKRGYFQDKLIKRRQNLSMRSTIVPEPSLHVDEIGLPQAAAMEMYKPYVVAKMNSWGIAPPEGQEEVRKGTDTAVRALREVVQERPAIAKRDPVLHKFGVMAFRPKLVEGKAIKIHPLVTGGFNADFDGDTMAVTIPMSQEAVEEAHKLLPSNNLFSPTTGRVMFTPGHESLLGLHLLSKWGKETGKTYSSIKELESAVDSGKAHATDVVKIHGLFDNKPTTLGRVLLESRLPRGFHKSQDILHNSGFEIDSKTLQRDISEPMAKSHVENFARSIDQLKDLGNDWAYKMGFSFGLKDFAPLKGRDSILNEAHKKVDEIKKTVQDQRKRDRAIIDVYSEATKKMDDVSEATLKNSGNRLAQMVYSGARGKKDQLRQMIAAPMLVQDSTNRTLPTPVTRSYSEGLDIGDYWLSQHGARKGIIQRNRGTSEPGAISKDIMNSTMSTVIVSPDCGTKEGIHMSIVPKPDDPSYKDAHDRFLAAPYKLKDGNILREGTLLTPEALNRLRNSKYDNVMVRSPLKCAHGNGICAKCFGLNEAGKLHQNGTNIGVLAGQSLGEPAVQMAMDAFHSGGVASSDRGARSVDRFTRLSEMIEMPSTLKDEATLAHASGTITNVRRDPTGIHISVDGKEYAEHFVPHRLVDDNIKPGMKVEKGQKLSEGHMNPLTFLRATKNIHAVQNMMTNEMYNGIYEKEGVRRRNIEVAVRALTNLTKVKDPGNSDLLHGDVVPRSVVDEYNRGLPKGAKPVHHEPVLVGVEQIPAFSQNWLARLNYRDLKRTIQEAASSGHRAEIHGTHPIPGIAMGAEFGKPPISKPKHVY